MTAEAAPGRNAKRYKLTCILATIALSAVGLAHSLSRHDATAPTALAAVNAAERSASFDHSDVDDDDSNDQLDDDGLYECTMGRPSVATAYANGSWGTIEVWCPGSRPVRARLSASPRLLVRSRSSSQTLGFPPLSRAGRVVRRRWQVRQYLGRRG